MVRFSVSRFLQSTDLGISKIYFMDLRIYSDTIFRPSSNGLSVAIPLVQIGIDHAKPHSGMASNSALCLYPPS